jgi:hypothetical protein
MSYEKASKFADAVAEIFLAVAYDSTKCISTNNQVIPGYLSAIFKVYGKSLWIIS